MSDFDQIGLRAELLIAVRQIGYVGMTPIQAGALPWMLKGRDVLGQAKTGSGKTAAFGLSILNCIDVTSLQPQALVVCPTRELAEQVAAEIRRLAREMPNLRVVSLCGGRPTRDQTQALKGGCHVVVGTPGRLGKHMRSRHLDCRSIRVVVLDEADRMLEMGFVEQVDELVRHCPSERQTLLFSATFPEEVAELSSLMQSAPKCVHVSTQVEPDRLKQVRFSCDSSGRWQAVADVLGAYRLDTSLVFCETRNDCEELAFFLREKGASVLALHGQLEQRDREDALLQFGNGSASVLVSTNVASRGLDIPAISLVVIAKVSADPEDHLHRIGRTGRAGNQGLAVTLVASDMEADRLKSIEHYMMQSIPDGPRIEAAGTLEFLQPPNRTLLILGGRKDKLRKGDVLGSLIKDAKIPPDAIGRIDLTQKICAVAVRRDHAEAALSHLREGRIKKKRFRAQLL